MKTDSRIGRVRTDTRQAGRIGRYHTWPTSQRQSIGEHSWQVLRIICTVWRLFPIPRDVFGHVIFHDVGEMAVGDPPYPIKRDNPDLKEIMDRLEEGALAEQGIHLPELSADWKWRVKIAHTLEMMEYGLDDMTAGDSHGSVVVAQMREFIQSQMDARPPGVTISEVEMIDDYLRDRLMRYAETSEIAEKTLGWITRVNRNPVFPESRRTEPHRPGSPADGGQHGPSGGRG